MTVTKIAASIFTCSEGHLSINNDPSSSDKEGFIGLTVEDRTYFLSVLDTLMLMVFIHDIPIDESEVDTVVFLTTNSDSETGKLVGLEMIDNVDKLVLKQQEDGYRWEVGKDDLRRLLLVAFKLLAESPGVFTPYRAK